MRMYVSTHVCMDACMYFGLHVRTRAYMSARMQNYAARKHREADVEVGFSGDAANICGRTAAAT